MHRIVIVGGGAGGLELATRLGRAYGFNCRRPKAEIILVDINPVHVWKPLLHGVAAGSIDSASHQLEYAAQAQWCGFEFQQGALKALDKKARTITLDAMVDEDGVECFPERTITYDSLVLAIGSVTNFFNVPGAKAHSFVLDTTKQAERFRRRLITACFQRQQKGLTQPMHITIVGAGATGVELAAELRHTMQALGGYGLNRLDSSKEVSIRIIEAGPRILPALPEKLANTTERLLDKLSVIRQCQTAVTRIDKDAVTLSTGETLVSDLTVWAAGVKGPDIFSQLDGFELNRQGQMVVKPTLQSVHDESIFAFGDCASCPWWGKPEGVMVPPRAQVAHQQSSFLFKQFSYLLKGKAMTEPFRYQDFGSLVSLAHTGAVGHLQDGVTSRGWFIRGRLAKWVYASLYRLHIASLHGWTRMVIDTLGQWFSRATRPRVKLH